MSIHKNIMVLDPAGNMWGSERVLLEFFKSKVVEGVKIGLCCPPKTPLTVDAKKHSVTVYPFFKARLHEHGKIIRFFAAVGLYVACKKFQADVIYVNQAGATRIALFVGRLLKIPVVPHVRLLEDVKYIENLDANECDMPKVLAVSNFIGNTFSTLEIKNRIKVIYDGYSMAKGEVINLPLNINFGNLCCAGRLVQMKGQDVLLKAISELRDQGLKPSLNIYGSGLDGDGYETYLKKLALDLNLTGQVKFHGFINDIPQEMLRHQAVVVPSDIEPLGRVVFEAWDAHCVPIVGAFSGGAAEVVNASRGGLLYDRQDPISLAYTLKKFLELPSAERSELVERGRKWVRQHCNPDKYSIEVLRVLDGKGKNK